MSACVHLLWLFDCSVPVGVELLDPNDRDEGEIAVVLACVAVPCLAMAQEAATAPQASIRHTAPIGHRQPTVAGVKGAQAGSVVAIANSSDIDRRLIICRGYRAMVVI